MHERSVFRDETDFDDFEDLKPQFLLFCSTFIPTGDTALEVRAE